MGQLSLSAFKKSMENLLENYGAKNFLLAVSGGADSMVLAHLFANSGLKFQVAHINYKLRGRDSDDDTKLVKDFCDKNQVKIHLYEVSEKDEKPEGSIQLWARELRYKFFRDIQKIENLEYLVTAHHLNDQLETFLINLSRGSGIKGLSGIPENDHKILRPLLHYPKNEIYRFAQEIGIVFREDLSNQKNEYLRNKIRNEIVPKLLETNDNFLENFSDSLAYMKSASDFLQKIVEQSFKELCTGQSNIEFILNRKKLFALDPFIVTEIIRKLGFSGDEIGKVRAAETGKFFRSKTHEISFERSQIICRKRPGK